VDERYDQNELDVANDLYDAVIGGARLSDVLDRLMPILKCDGLYFSLLDQRNDLIISGTSHGIAVESGNDYYLNYLPSDVRIPRVPLQPAQSVIDDAALIAPEERRRSAFHNEWIPRYALGELIHVHLAPSVGCFGILTCAQDGGRGPFSSTQRARLRGFIPHFQRAAAIRLRVPEAAEQAALASSVFGQMPIATIILDRSGRILIANDAASAILAGRDGLTSRDGRLDLTFGPATKALERLIREAVAPTLGETLEGTDAVAFVVRPSGRTPYRIHVAPIPRSSSLRQEETRAAAVLYIQDPDRQAPSVAEALRRSFRLTPAEAALAVAFSSGTTLRDYAECRGVTIGTVRYQMKEVMAKTGCHRQAELVRLLGTCR
jgi:DNA-binding CsgD family transcriptional regulator